MKMLLAGIIGVCASLLVACGSNSKLISSGNAGPLQNDFDSIASAVSSGDCNGAGTAVQKAKADLSALPAATDVALRDRLGQGLDALAQRATIECKANTQSTVSTQSTATTTPTTTTQTTSTATTTTDTTPSTTTDTTTATTPKTTDTTTSTDTTPVPDNGGGTPAPGAPGSGGASGGGN